MDNYGYKNKVLKAIEIVEEKGVEYGDTYGKVSEMLKVLYPAGCPTTSIGEMMFVSKVLEKLCRISCPGNTNKSDAFQDIVGYGLLGTERDNRIRERAEFLKEYRSDLIEKEARESEEKLAVLTASTQHYTYKKSPKDA
jgi:hypothetical protein